MAASTTTKKLPTLEEAAAELEAAEAKLSETRDRVVAGDSKVGADDIAKTASEVEHARLRVNLAREAAEKRDAEDQEARARAIVESITSGSVAEKGRAVVDAEAAAIDALQSLFDAARAYELDIKARYHDLSRLSPLPPEVTRLSTGSQPRLDVKGAHLPAANVSAWNEKVVFGAIYRALSPRQEQLAEDSKALVSRTYKALVGPLKPSEKRTRAEQLAETLERLAGGG